MNAVARPSAWPAVPPPRALHDMTMDRLDVVTAIEQAAYAFPWTRGNFIDSLAAGYPAQVLLDARGTLLGYFVAMRGVDELHLLNLTVAPAEQHRGHARFLLERLVRLCRTEHAASLWLEVRESNARARGLYLRFGFRHVGLRRNYYPAPNGQREHAAVMSFKIGPSTPPAEPPLDNSAGHGLV